MISIAIMTAKTNKATIKPYCITSLPSNIRYGKILFKRFAVDENGHIEHHSLPVNITRMGISGHQICQTIIIPSFKDENSFLLISDMKRKQNIEKINN